MPDSEKLPIILLVNPANTLEGSLRDYETSIYPNLGLLTLGSSLQSKLDKKLLKARVYYLDGALYGNEMVYQQIADLAPDIKVLGLSCYTYNYASCLEIAKYAKKVNPNIITIMGNDHFSALAKLIMRKRVGIIDYGFSGNDIVDGFTDFAIDLLQENRLTFSSYAGLVYRGSEEDIKINPENYSEFNVLPLVNYQLQDSLLPHDQLYHNAQKTFYSYVKDDSLKVTVVDIARGCLKFAGKRSATNIPMNACDFCGIIPGAREVAYQSSLKSWEILRNAYEQGYNYLFLTADEFPSTFWKLAKEMVDTIPNWYTEIPQKNRPKIMCYARADSFRENYSQRIDLLMNKLGFDHFFVGLDGFTTSSLQAMRKGLNSNNTNIDLSEYNFKALSEISRRNGKVTAGAVITHFGITNKLLEQNFEALKNFVELYAPNFVELDFELLCPIPGSHAFSYLTVPGAAQKRAQELGVEVNNNYLSHLYEKYKEEDLFNPEELINDFIISCCPDINVDIAHEYLKRIRDLVDKYHIPYECSSL